MRILKDFKLPKFKFPKMKMKGISEIDEVKLDYEALKKAEENHEKKEKITHYEPTTYKTIKEVFKRSMEKYADNVFILEKFDPKGSFKEIKFEQFGRDVIGLGTALIRKLQFNNERVIIIGENTYYWYVSYMAMLCGAGIAVPTDKELPENEILNIIERSKATAVIFSTKESDKIKKIADEAKNVKYFIQMNSNEELKDRYVGIEYLIEEGNALVDGGDNSFMDIEIDPDEFKVLLFTSGTTAKSKGVMLCNRNLAENINAVSAYVILREDDRLFSVLPLHHTYESTIGFLLPFATGSSIAICQGLKHIVPNMQETHPTALLAVPILVETLYKRITATIKKSKKDGLVNSMIHVTNALKTVGVDIKRKVFSEIHENLGGKLRIIVSAAAPIDAKVGKWVQDIGIMFLQGYGLTETAPIAAFTAEFTPQVGSAGKPLISAKAKVNNPNENGEGEIMLCTPTLMLGYYEDEEATNEAIEIIDGERWFHTGDIGYIDKDGFIYITGRSKNVIVTQNGKNIYPEEIELLLSKIPEIKECMVYGKPDERDKNNKELIISVKVIQNYEYIEEEYKKKLDEKEIHDLIWGKVKEVNKQLTSYKAIKYMEIKKDEFVKTTTMKIKRYEELKKDNK